MRKYHQKQIFGLLGTIKEAQAAGLYADCQDGALVIGEFIESIEGENTQTVTLLEEYCDLVFMASNGETGEKVLRRKLIDIENSIRREFKANTIEMVFLSYKASMSDSLESIYLAAKEDPDCDAYWIPIPYYDLNSDGTFKEMQFDGADLYGSRIECTNWQEYDFETRHPDVVFTFNPYDNENLVTSVHPDFYCKRLCELTECLVYVPYYVTVKNLSDEFCIVAGCRYAHKVVLQSEKVREKFIQVFTKEIGNLLGNPKERFIALGSPKFDKVINAKREDYPLPEKWAKLINGKKVILYNISIGGLLRGYEQYMKKMRHVIETYKNREDVILWWRPHPLIESTLAAMRPMYLAEYSQLMSEFISGEYGIFDDTTDLHRALVWTDAYYGDASSLVTMYQAMGKPVFGQQILSTEDRMMLQFADFTFDDTGKAWGYDIHKDGLFELDLTNDEARYLARSGCIPKHLGEKKFLAVMRYLRICCVDDEVICFPNYLDNIFVCNIKSGGTRIIGLDHKYLLSPESDGFAVTGVIRYEGKIYCFGAFCKAVIVYDIAGHSVSYHTKIFEHIGQTVEFNDIKYVKGPLYCSQCADNGKVTLIMSGCEKLISYSLPTKEVNDIAINPILTRCVLAEYDGQDYWLIEETYDKLIKWNPVSNETTLYSIAGAGYTIPEKPGVYTGIVDFGQYILIFPGIGEAILRFDKKAEQFSEYDKLPMPSDGLENVYKYSTPKRVGNKLYAFARFNNMTYEIDMLSEKITGHKIMLGKDSQERFVTEYCEAFFNIGNEVFADNKYHSIDGYDLRKMVEHLEDAKSGAETKNANQYSALADLSVNTDGTAGKAIYNYFKNITAGG